MNEDESITRDTRNTGGTDTASGNGNVGETGIASGIGTPGETGNAGNIGSTTHKKICFASSSGGHFEQLMCLKEALMKKYPSFVVTEETSGTKNTTAVSDIDMYYLEIINRKERDFPKILVENTRRSWRILKKERPPIIITTGVLSVIPLCLMGKFLYGAKLIYIESFAKTDTPTLTGRLMYRIADKFMVQWESMLKVYPKAVYKGGVF